MGLETYARWKKGSVLALRLTIGFLFAAHGMQKLFGMFGGKGIEGTAQFITAAHLPLPVFLAYAVGALELIGGLFYIFGFLTRWAALWFTIQTTITTLLQIFVLHTSYATAWQLDLVLFAGSLVILSHGPEIGSIDALLDKQRTQQVVGTGGK